MLVGSLRLACKLLCNHTPRDGDSRTTEIMMAFKCDCCPNVVMAGLSLAIMAFPTIFESPIAQKTSSESICATPTWIGCLWTAHDALIILEACFIEKLSYVSRRVQTSERSNLIVSQNVFVYEENASSIKRWTDGLTWSPSRTVGDFLIYRELRSPFQAGGKRVVNKRRQKSRKTHSLGNINTYARGSFSVICLTFMLTDP